MEVNASERLRHLAIYLEGTSEAGAVGLDRIYQAALRLSPDEPSNWHSRGITAKHFAIIADNARERARHAQAALKHLKRAAALLPEDPDILYSLGKWEHAFGSKRAALGYFDRVLSQAPNHGFARLFRAYALHDSSSWDEAVRAYREVPLEQFTGSKAYIADEVLMNRADCRLMSGDREGALQDLQRLLERLEKEPHRAEPLELRRLEEACLGQLSAELKERWLRLGLVGNERVAQGQPPRPLQ